ncbi:MAG TPA: methyltransferase domain-containing protein [Burkholderiaceae bacterium]|nr:methyltransferase domain-containing protein [Burkholderiaceae bacterium]
MIRSAGRRVASRVVRSGARLAARPLQPGRRRPRIGESGSAGWTFFKLWLRDPLRIAAIMPSGASLAAAMTEPIAPVHAPVIELGPGTGVFTRALLARGIPEHRIALVELGHEFAELLERRFPRATLVRLDASRLGGVQLFGGELAGAVVSGLPLLAMPPARVRRVLQDAFARLRPDGAFYQFTYGFRCPVPERLLERLGLRATRIAVTLRNVPPAAVYRIERLAARAAAR